MVIHPQLCFYRLRQSHNHDTKRSLTVDLPHQIAVFVETRLHPPYGIASEVIVIDVSRLSEEGTEQREGCRGHGGHMQSRVRKMDGR